MKNVFVIYAIIIAALLPLSIMGQSHLNFQKCGHQHVLEVNETKFPGYKKRVAQSFDQAQRWSQTSGANRNEVLTIPIVFHIVWKNQVENLPDSVIFSQLKVLNETYRLLNADRANIRPIFKDLQADAGIEFVLSDIKRVKTNADFELTFSGLPDNVKVPNQGGSLAIDPDRTLNIWVCNIKPIPFIGGQILGYAYPPAGLDNWPEGASAPTKNLEGIVIDYRVLGSNNPNTMIIAGQKYEALGKTAVHEVGHYLGLRHIWGDGGGIFGGDSCSEDDGITDTPNQGSQSEANCDPFQNTCEDDFDDLPDMIENYMDYSLESCQNTFTKDQVALMRSVLTNQRKLLVNLEDTWLQNVTTFIYPNPVQDVLYFKKNDVLENFSFELANGLGIILQRGELQQGFIDTKYLQVGVYFLKISDGQRSKWIKFVKSND